MQKSNISIYFHVHLVSDSTGETLVAMMKASCAQFKDATALEHLHSLIRSNEQLESVLQDIEARPGIVLYTLLNNEHRRRLEEKCAELNMPNVSVLDTTLATLGRYLGAPIASEVGAQRNLDADYYNRIEALDYAMTHDDGQSVMGLKEADIILLGISRTSKTPTCIYLANRGYKAGNIPLVPGTELPAVLDGFTKPFIVGLVANPVRIVQIREQRMLGLNETRQTDYIDQKIVSDEIKKAKRMFVKKGYPFVDVTRRSIEETAAKIINLYQAHKGQY